ncbi:MAG: divalent metal cation transporter [Betaproteobacteria bacterium]|nr:divalent metal cation transporter [Betaproteobacteria bacterium]
MAEARPRHAGARRTGFASHLGRRVPRRLSRLGPGLITGAADDDPSGIATYSQAGASFGFGLLWTVVFTLPLMIAIQIVSARIGYVTRRGLTANIKTCYPRPIVLSLVAMLVAANTLNIAAMAEAARLLLGGSAHLYAAGFGMLCLLLQVFLPYRTYVRWLTVLTLALLAYVGVAFTLHVDWWNVMVAAVRPGLPAGVPRREMLLAVVAVLGTTISPYLFFWQAAQEMEAGIDTRPHTPRKVRHHLRRIDLDTIAGMTISNLIAFCIILSTAATLHASGVTNIQTSVQAAQALRPMAGDLSALLFSLGIVGTGMLAVPVLAGSAAYAVAEAAGWRGSMKIRVENKEGRRFYGIVLCFTPSDPVRELFWAAVFNGVTAVPVMAVMMHLASRPDVMGTHVIGARLRVLGWLATAVMTVVVAAMGLSFV